MLLGSAVTTAPANKPLRINPPSPPTDKIDKVLEGVVTFASSFSTSPAIAALITSANSVAVELRSGNTSNTPSAGTSNTSNSLINSVTSIKSRGDALTMTELVR